MTPPQRVYWGTAWTSQTLLAREKRHALEAQKEDGQQRLFEITAAEVGAEVPEYLNFVEAEIRKHGRNHPFVKTQYFCEEIDAEGGMFPPARQALMKGDHIPLNAPEQGKLYAFLIDVAGEDEAVISLSEPNAGSFANPQSEILNHKSRDSTALTIVEIDLTTLSDDLIQAPRYLVRHRRSFVPQDGALDRHPPHRPLRPVKSPSRTMGSPLQSNRRHRCWRRPRLLPRKILPPQTNPLPLQLRHQIQTWLGLPFRHRNRPFQRPPSRKYGEWRSCPFSRADWRRQSAANS